MDEKGYIEELILTIEFSAETAKCNFIARAPKQWKLQNWSSKISENKYDWIFDVKFRNKIKHEIWKDRSWYFMTLKKALQIE